MLDQLRLRPPMASDTASPAPAPAPPPTGEEQLEALADVPQQPPPTDEAPLPWTARTMRWDNIVIVVVMHVWVLHSVTVMPRARWQTWLWLLFLWTWVGFGVLGGAHRLWSHRSYKAVLPLRVFLMMGNSMAGMYCIWDWVRDHRVHHRYTDTDGDPHNSKRGFFFSHIGWIMVPPHPLVIRARKEVNMSDIDNDPVCAFEKKFHMPLVYLLCFAMPILVPIFMWDESWSVGIAVGMVRWVFEVNAILSINSFAHMFGGRPFNKTILPAENKWVSIVSLGEGWHNYHHVFPWDYRASEYGFLNTTMHLIGLCQRLGWAYDLKTAPSSLVRRVATRYGDGSHPDRAAYVPEVPEAAAEDPSLVEALLTPPPPPPNTTAPATNQAEAKKDA
ncbi:Acyl-CoA Delta(11) desaturase [Gryllus bimaculatus]|nr:Acyl-CoA Delta(11) desaturase [Gryllus bimaculatus]